jgi:hypothetical protein
MKTEVVLKDGSKLDFVGMAVTIDPESQEIVIIDPHCTVEGEFPYDQVKEVHFYPEAK